MSVYGDLEVPELGIVIPYRHEAVVDATIAESLIASGSFVAVNRPGDTTDSGASTADPTSPTGDAPTDATSGAADTTTDPEEKNQ